MERYLLKRKDPPADEETKGERPSKRQKKEEVIEFWKPRDPHGYLSNYWPAPVEVDGVTFGSTEHYYQMCKYDDEWMREQIRKAPSPHLSRELAYMRLQKYGNDAFNEIVREAQRRECKVRAQWGEDKDNVMKRAVLAKFRQNKELRSKLDQTGTAHIVEASPFDSYWGHGKDGRGKNKLGILLKQVRALLRREKHSGSP